jgi:plasmid stability protein
MKTHTKRTTVYLDSDLHHALRVKAAQSDVSMSEMVEQAVRLSLMEDALDIEAFEKRKGEKSLPFESVLKKLSRDGKI